MIKYFCSSFLEAEGDEGNILRKNPVCPENGNMKLGFSSQWTRIKSKRNKRNSSNSVKLASSISFLDLMDGRKFNKKYLNKNVLTCTFEQNKKRGGCLSLCTKVKKYAKYTETTLNSYIGSVKALKNTPQVLAIWLHDL